MTDIQKNQPEISDLNKDSNELLVNKEQVLDKSLGSNGLHNNNNGCISHHEKVLPNRTNEHDSVKSLKTDIAMSEVVEISLKHEQEDSENTIPDGGYGWVIALVGFLINFVMMGTASIWGVFSNAYATTVLKDKATTMELMGVGTVRVVCLNMFSPLSPLLAPLGAQITLLIGSTLMGLSLALAGFSTEVWHLYLTQGVLFGIGSSVAYMCVVSVIPQWFTTRRGTAMGISSAGTGFGGLALSPMVTSLVDKYSLPWAHRIIGLMCFGICLVACTLIRTRLPPTQRKAKLRNPIKISMLNDFNFVLMLFGVVVALTGYLVPLYYLPTYATSFGISHSDSSDIVGVACAMNAVGRLALGFVADRIGRLNMYVISSTLAGLFCMLLWPFATTYGPLMAFAVLFGFTCGSYYALASPITLAVVGQDNVSSALSILFIVSSVAATGPPVASAIQEATPNKGYIGVQMFAGAVYIFGSLLCMLLKFKMTGSFFSKM